MTEIRFGPAENRGGKEKLGYCWTMQNKTITKALMGYSLKDMRKRQGY